MLALLGTSASALLVGRTAPPAMMADRVFSPADAKGGVQVNPSRTAVLFIEYQNEFTTEGGKLHDAVKGTMGDMLSMSAMVADKARAAGATALAQLIAVHPERIVGLQTLDGGIQGIGHMAVHRRQPRTTGMGASAPGHGFVVIPAILSGGAHGHIVHGPLAGSGNRLGGSLGQRPQHHIHHPGAGFHIASRHCRRTIGIEQRTLRG